MTDTKTTKTGKVIRFPRGDTLPECDDRKHHITLADVWRDKTQKGRYVRLQIRGTSVCLIEFLFIALGYITPNIPFWNDMYLWIMIFIFVVWTLIEIWDSLTMSIQNEFVND